MRFDVGWELRLANFVALRVRVDMVSSSTVSDVESFLLSMAEGRDPFCEMFDNFEELRSSLGPDVASSIAEIAKVESSPWSRGLMGGPGAGRVPLVK